MHDWVGCRYGDHSTTFYPLESTRHLRGRVIKGDKKMSYPIEIQERPGQATASIRTRASVSELPELMGQTFDKLMQYFGKVGAQPAGPPFAAYYNMDMQNLDVEIGFPVSEAVAGEGEIEAQMIPAGKYASCLYTGPYEEIELPYNALAEWLKEKGREGTGISYEFYLNDPQETSTDQLQTQILFPLKDE
jgi:effector-binding domain-containing protein